MSGKKVDTIALFAALSLFLSIVELVIPKPIPFFRIGLANLPLLIALTIFTRREFVVLVLLKVFGQAIVGGTLFSYVFLFSAAGSLTAGAVMLLLRPLYPRQMSLVGIGVLGALGSNIAQLLFAAWMIFGSSTRLIAPLFLLMGSITGTLLGVIAQFILRRSRWLANYRAGVPLSAFNDGAGPKRGENLSAQGSAGTDSRENSSAGQPARTRVPVVRLLLGLLMIPPFILQPLPVLKVVQILLFALYGRWMGKRIRLLPGVVITLTVTAAAVMSPLGEVLFSIGRFPVTAGALHEGVVRGLNLVGMVYLSRCTISPQLRVPGRAGRLLYRVFYYFEELTAVRLERGERKGLLENVKEKLLFLDERLLQWSREGDGAGSVNPGLQKGTAERQLSDYLRLPLIFLLLQWILFLWIKTGLWFPSILT